MTYNLNFDTKSLIVYLFPLFDCCNKIDIAIRKYEEDEKNRKKSDRS